MRVVELAAPLEQKTPRDIQPYAVSRLSAAALGVYSVTLFTVTLSVCLQSPSIVLSISAPILIVLLGEK